MKFPGEKTPQHARIIQKWHHRDDWESLADAVDREVREKVVKKIANELEAEEKYTNMPIYYWRIIDRKATEKRREEVEQIATALVQEENRDKITLEAALQQIRYQLTLKNKSGEPVILEPLAITQSVSAIDKAITSISCNESGFSFRRRGTQTRTGTEQQPTQRVQSPDGYLLHPKGVI